MHSLPATLTTAQHFVNAFSWMLLHSLWIGLLIALITGVMLALSGNASAKKRYNLVLVNFLVLVVGCAVVFAWEWYKTGVENVSAASILITGQRPAAILGFNFETLKHFSDSCLAYFSANAPTIVLLWFIFFVYRSVRLISGAVYIHRAKRRYIFSAGQDWNARMQILCDKLGIRRTVKLLESGYAKVPVVIGSLKPVILIPLGMLTAIPAGQVEAILLHELAHIRRHDFLVNLLQAVAETMFFFNPGLLWMSSLLREERENCCDDIALGQTKNKKEFVQALVSFREHSLYGGKYQVAFAGRKNQLLNRASRIISNKNRAFGTPEKASFTAGVIILLAVLSTAAVTSAESVRKSIFRHVPAVTKIVDAGRSVQTPVKALAAITQRQPHHRVLAPDSVATATKDSLQLAADVAPKKQPDGEKAQPDGQLTAFQSKSLADARLDTRNPGRHLDDKEQGLLDHQQAIKDQEDAKRDQAQAKIDQANALRDQEEARRDQEQAKIDQQEARRDQEQGKKDHAQDDQTTQQQDAANREQATGNEKQARLNKIQEQKNAEQTKRNEEQAKRNAEEARLNNIQDAKNQEQVKRNQEQARLNKEQDAKNQEQAERNRMQALLNKEQQKKNQAQAIANTNQEIKNAIQAKLNEQKVRTGELQEQQNIKQTDKSNVNVQE